MSWVFVDDGFYSDFRIEGVSLEATGLFVRGTSHSARHLLDGYLPKRWVARRVPLAKKRARIVGELVAEGLWVERDDHYEIVPVIAGRGETLIGHDDRGTVERRRDDERKRKAAQREAKRAENGSPDGSVTVGHPRESRRSPGRGGARKEDSYSKGALHRGYGRLGSQPRRARSRPVRAERRSSGDGAVSASSHSPIPRIALRREEAAVALGVSDDHFDARIKNELRCVRSGRLKLYPVAELERWLEKNAVASLGKEVA